MVTISPFGGWLLDRAVEIDEHCPGLAGHILRASSERRHVIAAYLSTDASQSFVTQTDLGLYLMTAGHRDILAAAFGSLPEGFRSAVARGGMQPYSRWHYRYLHRLMVSSTRPATKGLIRHLARVNPTRLKIARALSEDLQIAPLVMALRNVEAARDLDTLVMLLKQSGADRAAMVGALAAVTTMEDVGKFAKRWAFRVALPRHPVPASEGYEPVKDTADLRKLAIDFRNCARNYVGNALEGRSAFAVVTDLSSQAVVHLIRAGDRWSIDDFYGRGNAPPDRNLTNRWTEYLAQHGVRMRHFSQSAHRWASFRRLAGHMDYELDFEA